RQRAEAATPGPWHNPHDDDAPDANAITGADGQPVIGLGENPFDGGMYLMIHESDASFVTQARTDIPRLLADREVLVKLLARAHGYLTQLVDHNDIFIDPEDVERVNEFCKEIEDAGVLAQVEGQET